MEDKRLVLRYLLSEKLNSKYTVEAIESLEPNVPWTEWFLENRARIYVAVRHPLAGAARRDLQQFQAWAGRRN
jgi:aromatic ring-cleaving dioxygenase